MKKIIALSALMAALASANAMAVDANLTFTGSVTSSTCTMNAADATKNIVLPDYPVSALAGAWTSVGAGSTITFTSCPASVSNLITAVTSTTGTQLTTTNKVTTPASGTATGVGLLFAAGSSKSNLAVDGSNTVSTAVSGGTAVVPIYVGLGKAQAWASSAPAAAAGNYSSSYTLTFSWS